MESDIDGGGGSVLLEALDDSDRAQLLQRARSVKYSPAETIYAIEDPGDTMLLIDKGRVEVSVTSMTGRKSVLNHMGPGEVVGEIALLDNGPRSADVVAATEVEGVLLHRRDLLSFLAEHPETTLSLLAEVCAKVRNASEMFASQSQTIAQARLARCLLRLGRKWGDENAEGDVRLTQQFSQGDLGEFSGLARENVNRHLKTWVSEGILAFDGRQIVLHEIEMLEDIAYQ
jgi:CRP-like cAMP-binding protein